MVACDDKATSFFLNLGLKKTRNYKSQRIDLLTQKKTANERPALILHAVLHLRLGVGGLATLALDGATKRKRTPLRARDDADAAHAFGSGSLCGSGMVGPTPPGNTVIKAPLGVGQVRPPTPRSNGLVGVLLIKELVRLSDEKRELHQRKVAEALGEGPVLFGLPPSPTR